MSQHPLRHAGKSGMKKSTIRWTIILAVVIVGVVALYTFLLNRSRRNVTDAKLSTVQLVLSRSLQNDYPATVKEVVKYYTEIEKCFYNEEYTDQELEELGMKARELYDDELLAANEVGTYLQKLKADINVYKESGRRMTGAAVGASTSVKYDEKTGFAKINCSYTFVKNHNTYDEIYTYLLRQDENKRWKIYGWKKAEAD